MQMSVLPTCLYVHLVSAWWPRSQNRVSDPLVLELMTVMSYCECWEPEPKEDPLQEQQVLITSEPSLKPLHFEIY